MNELEIPTCITAESWADFVEVRRAKGKRAPWTKGAAKRVAAKLIEADRQGYDAQYMIDQAIERGWTSVFVGDDTPRRDLAAKNTSEYLERRQAVNGAPRPDVKDRILKLIRRC